MKKQIFKIIQWLAVGFLLTMASCMVEGVSTIPEEPGVVIGVPPWPDGIWIGGEWWWNTGEHRYIWHEGHWAHGGHGTWEGGHWNHGGHGYRYQHGRWR